MLGYPLEPMYIFAGSSGPQTLARHRASTRPTRTRRARAAARDPYINQCRDKLGSSRPRPIALSTAPRPPSRQ
jgi:hypothetical protein